MSFRFLVLFIVRFASLQAVVFAKDLVDVLASDGQSSSLYPLGECEGHCERSNQCFYDLKCFQRSSAPSEQVPGCQGSGTPDSNYCYLPLDSNELAYVGRLGLPSSSFPLKECQGTCNNDNDCAGSLKCFRRSKWEEVPGCKGQGYARKDYCYQPITTPEEADTPNEDDVKDDEDGQEVNLPAKEDSAVTYLPGELTVRMEGLRLSQGLTARKIATKNQRVRYANGNRSSKSFHSRPDGAAIFQVGSKYYYVSNSEEGRNGGVGSIEFDRNGNVLGYQRVLTGTKQNCGGGKSPFNTWLSCEEDGNHGRVWEVSPDGSFEGRQTNVVPYGGNFESVAFHYDSSRDRNVYYVTEDHEIGALVQFIPSSNLGTREEMYSEGAHRFLRLNGSGESGTFSWETNWNRANPNRYPYAEGIDIKDGILYFTVKRRKQLFILNLEAQTFTRESTKSGAFQGQPDQVARILGPGNKILYFREDGGSYCGIHGRDQDGRYLTILDNDPNRGSFEGETTGLAFSPDFKRMYVSFQEPGYIFEIKRTDGLPFNGDVVDIKYHGD